MSTNMSSYFQAATSTSAGDEETGVLAGGLESMEASQLDIERAERELSETEQLTSQFEDLSGSLESYREQVVASQESGTLTPEAAGWMLSAGQELLGRVNVELTSVSHESFSTPTDAADSAELVSVEADGVIAKLVKMIKDLIEKAKVQVKKLWNKIFDGSPKIAKRAGAMAKRAGEMGNAETTEKSFSSDGILNKVHKDGKVLTGSAVVSEAEALAALAKELFSKSDNTVSKLHAAYVNSNGADPASFVSELAKVSIPGVTNNAGSSDAHLFGSANGTNKKSRTLLGDRVVFVGVPNSGDSAEAAVKNFVMGVGPVKATDSSVKGDLATLSTDEVKKLSSAIEEAAKAVAAFRKDFDSRDKMRNELSSALDKIAKDAKNEEDKEKAKQMQDMVKLAKSAMKAYNQPYRDFGPYLLSTLSSLIAYGEKSLSLHKKKDA